MHASKDIVFKCCISTMCSFYAALPSAGYFLVEVVHRVCSWSVVTHSGDCEYGGENRCGTKLDSGIEAGAS